MEQERSAALFEEAKQYFPGGVNSPVRAFRSVGGTPRFIVKGKGSRVWDADGNEYVDLCASWGPMILGHAHDTVIEAIQRTAADGTSFGAPTVQENRLAKLIIDHHPHVERLRFVSSGTEAVMSAIRLARGYTNRPKVIKFEGCFHGHADSMLVKAGSGLVTFGSSSSAGVPESFVNETVVVPLNSEEAVRAAFAQFRGKIAAVIIEPVPANNGLLLQDGHFLRFLRSICDEEGALLIFDEVISGFRVGFQGAAGHYGIRPDILTFGKIIGGGMPVGAYASSAEVMAQVSPLGPVYQAGTLSGNPVAMAAGAATLTECLRLGFYEMLEEKTLRLTEAVSGHARQRGYPFRIFSIASIFWLAFSDSEAIRAADEIDPASMDIFRKFYHSLLDMGVYMGPSGYEVGFISAAHTEEDIALLTDRMASALDIAFR